MSQSGEEMIAGLSKLLQSPVVTKTASAKSEVKPVIATKPTKKSAMVTVLKELAKLASELDESGAWAAAQLVDDSIVVISKDVEEMEGEDEDITEIFEEDAPVSGNEEGMGSRMERMPPVADPSMQEMSPEGLGMGDFTEGGAREDNMDVLFRDPAFRARVKEILGQ